MYTTRLQIIHDKLWGWDVGRFQPTFAYYDRVTDAMTRTPPTLTTHQMETVLTSAEKKSRQAMFGTTISSLNKFCLAHEKEQEKKAKRARVEAEKQMPNKRAKKTSQSELFERLRENKSLTYDPNISDGERDRVSTANREIVEEYEMNHPPRESPPLFIWRGSLDPTYFPIGSAVPSAIMTEDQIEEHIANVIVPWLFHTTDTEWWNNVVARLVWGHGMVVRKIYCHPNSPRLLYDLSSKKWCVWSGQVWEQDATEAKAVGLVTKTLFYVYKYRAKFLEHELTAIDKDVEYFDTAFGDFEAGIDKDTDDVYRKISARLINQQQSMKEQLKYFKDHSSKVCDGILTYRVIGAIIKGDVDAEKFKSDETTVATVWDTNPALISDGNGVLMWGTGCSKKDDRGGYVHPIHRAGHPTDFCRVSIKPGVHWKPEFDAYVRDGTWAKNECGHPCPVWHRFIREILGQKELEKRREAGVWGDESEGQMLNRINREYAALQEILGANMSCEVKWQMILVMFNKQGRNGKGVAADTLQQLGGDIVSTIAKSCLITDAKRGFGSADNTHSGHLFTVKDPHLGIVSESGAHRVWNVETANGISGDDMIKARRPNATKSEYFKPKSMMWLLCNLLPAFPHGVDDALKARLVLLNLMQRFLTKSEMSHPPKFNEHVRDESLKVKLAAEFPAILAWCRRGMEIVDQRGSIYISPSMERYKSNYIDGCDIAVKFLKDCCIHDSTIDNKCAVPVEWLAEMSKAWCRTRGQKHPADFREKVLKYTGLSETVKTRGYYDGQKQRYAHIQLALDPEGRNLADDDWFKRLLSTDPAGAKGNQDRASHDVEQVITFDQQQKNHLTEGGFANAP